MIWSDTLGIPCDGYKHVDTHKMKLVLIFFFRHVVLAKKKHGPYFEVKSITFFSKFVIHIYFFPVLSGSIEYWGSLNRSIGVSILKNTFCCFVNSMKLNFWSHIFTIVLWHLFDALENWFCSVWPSTMDLCSPIVVLGALLTVSSSSAANSSGTYSLTCTLDHY